MTRLFGGRVSCPRDVDAGEEVTFSATRRFSSGIQSPLTIAGLSLPTKGVVTLEGRTIKRPDPERMVVFQNYSLLPWRTVRENIALAVNSAMDNLSN